IQCEILRNFPIVLEENVPVVLAIYPIDECGLAVVDIRGVFWRVREKFFSNLSYGPREVCQKILRCRDIVRIQSSKIRTVDAWHGDIADTKSRIRIGR